MGKDFNTLVQEGERDLRVMKLTVTVAAQLVKLYDTYKSVHSDYPCAEFHLNELRRITKPALEYKKNHEEHVRTSPEHQAEDAMLGKSA